MSSTGDIAKHAADLIEKAVGGTLRPWQIKRVAVAEAQAKITHANADAETKIIHAKADIEISEIQLRTRERVAYEEERNQKNIESIVSMAIPLLNEDAKPKDINNDWMANFTDKCKLISDDEMQSLWARILAGEANAPGKFSRRTINFLNDLDKRDAEMFTLLCRFCLIIDTSNDPVIRPYQDTYYTSFGLDFPTFSHLSDIGLIRFNYTGDYIIDNLPQLTKVQYFDEYYTIKFRSTEPKGNDLRVGNVLFSTAGQELASICKSTKVDGYSERIINSWKGKATILEITRHT